MLTINGDRVMQLAVAVGQQADFVRSEDAIRGDAAHVQHGQSPLHALAFLGGDSPARPLALALFIQRAWGWT